MPKIVRWIIATLIFLALLGVVEHFIGWAKLLADWRNISASQLVALTLLTLASYLLRAERVFRYFGQIRGHSRLSYLRISFIHNALNNFLPMRLGEAAFPILMKRELDTGLSQSTSGLIWIRLIDLHVLCLIGALALYPRLGSISSLGIATLFLVPLLLFKFRGLALRQIPSKLRTKLEKLSHLLPDSLALFAQTYLLTLVIWLLKIWALALTLQVFLQIDSASAWVATILADFSSVLPVHGLAGSGTYEAAMLAALIPMGYAAKEALAAAVNVHLYLLGVSALSVPLALLVPRASSPR